MALLATFKALLSRYARQNDIVVGTPVSTRTHSELEQLIGCFINTHALRTEIPAGLTARELLARVRTTVLESLANADVPFETILTEMVNERDLSRPPLFQTAFILQNTPMSSDYQVVGGGTTFDMTLYMLESSEIMAAVSNTTRICSILKPSRVLQHASRPLRRKWLLNQTQPSISSRSSPPLRKRSGSRRTTVQLLRIRIFANTNG
jgi:hypothetical protein